MPKRYFKSLKSKPNPEVFAAFTAYASAYFHHRVIVSLDDMNEKDVADLYARDLSIFGTRPLVCTGYALLGAHLLKLAGASVSVQTFILGTRATDQDVLNDSIEAGHALAVMTRQGKTFFVSNHLIVFTENDGIGPNAVAWGNKNAQLDKTSGKTIPAANAKLSGILTARKAALEKAAAKKPAKKK